MPEIVSKADHSTIIGDPAVRAISFAQLQDFEEFVHTSGPYIDGASEKFDLVGNMALNPNAGQPLLVRSVEELCYSHETEDMAKFTKYFNMYELVGHIVRPMTAPTDAHPGGVAYVETVASRPQPPNYFISHFWGEKFLLFFGSIKSYIQSKHLSSETTLWICSLANRQWSIKEELGSTFIESPFYRALHMEETRGMLMVTTVDCASLHRIWCLFETNEGMMLANEQNFTVHLCLREQDNRNTICVGISGGNKTRTMSRSISFHPSSKDGGGGDGGDGGGGDDSIPADTAAALLGIKVEDAKASSEDDRKMIVKHISETSGFSQFNYTLKLSIARGIYDKMFHDYKDKIGSSGKEGLDTEGMHALKFLWEIVKNPATNKIDNPKQLLAVLKVLNQPPENEEQDLLDTFDEWDYDRTGTISFDDYVTEICQRIQDGIQEYGDY